MANGINMDTLSQLGALGAAVVIVGIIGMAITRGMTPVAAPPGAAPPVPNVTEPFLYKKVSNAMYGKSGCGCGR